MKITYDQWLTYEPEPNMLNDGAPFDGCMFETYGEEHDYVLSVARERNGDSFIWTLVDGDGVDAIVAGYHIVNRLGYFVTKAPAVGVVDVELESAK